MEDGRMDRRKIDRWMDGGCIDGHSTYSSLIIIYVFAKLFV
jgi:hypothetical protein